MGAKYEEHTGGTKKHTATAHASVVGVSEVACSQDVALQKVAGNAACGANLFREEGVGGKEDAIGVVCKCVAAAHQ